jgi:parallel beta-helix repeat protein
MKNLSIYGSRFVGLALLGLLLWLAPAAQAATLFVSNTNDSGAGSLRQAIITANNTASLDTIEFNIPGAGVRTITPTSQLPEITKPLIIDGTSQPGYSGTPLIELNGSLAGPTAHGLLITGGNSWIKGLAINRFKNCGIYLDNLGQNTISGNHIGVSPSGNTDLGNNNGLVVNTPISTVGGTTAAARNIISGNKFDGLVIGDKATGSIVRGNHLGTNAAGTAALANGGHGIYLNSAENVLIGGVIAGARNVISGNGYYGLYISQSNSNTIQGNYIGTDVNGTGPLGNVQGGVYLAASANNLIGGNVAAASNVISANTSHGIGIRVDISVGNQIKGNFIGSEKSGTNPLPNTGYGIYIREDVTGTKIGGLNAGEKNFIAFNLRGGILIDSGTGDEILRNSLVVNRGLGIDLGSEGVQPNDPGDADAGANNLQNYPSVTSVSRDLSSTIFTGVLNSKPNTEYRVEFFYVGSPDTNGSCQGQYYLSTIPSLITNASGDANFNVTLPLVLAPIGQYVTATATDSSGNTSEFSPCTLITPKGAGTFSFGAATISSGEFNGSALLEVKRTDGSTGAVSVNFATSNGTATAPGDYTSNSGTLNFAAGETSKILPITVFNDALDETNETFTVTLSNPAGGATLGNPNTITVTIIDDDPQPAISISDVSLAEGNSGLTNLGFNVSLSAASGQTVTVNYATIAGGTATPGNDYQPTSGTLTFAAGEISKPVTVLVNGDTQDEPNKTLFVQLSGQTNATLAKAQGIGTILNDDAAVIRFSSGNYSVAEGAGFKTMTVERSGDTSQAVTVDYASSDHSTPADFLPCNSPGAGFASSRCDFTTAIGTLRFAAGETTKTFNVLISQDNYVEGTETLQLTLSNATGGAVFAAPSTAFLSITDDVTEPATNSSDTSSEFVRSQYHDFLNREPDAPGLAFWVDNIEKCNDEFRRPPSQTVAQCIDKQRESTAVAFFQSPEFQITGGFVYHLYKGSLTGSPNYDGGSPGRFPTSLEFMRDLSAVSEGIVVNNQISGAVVEANRNRLAAEFVQRPEFVAKYGGLNHTLFVDELFNTTGITATAAEKQALVSGLTGGMETRASVLRKVVDGTVVISEGNVQFTTTYGQAFSIQENRRVFVFMEYVGYLRRNPDPSGFVFWLGKLNTYNGDPFVAEMVRSFILAPEYRNRFGQ